MAIEKIETFSLTLEEERNLNLPLGQGWLEIRITSLAGPVNQKVVGYIDEEHEDLINKG